jgi:hypothetical protein
MQLKRHEFQICVAQHYLGADKRYYEPTEQGVEKKINERVEKWRAMARGQAKKAQNEGCPYKGSFRAKLELAS